MSFKKIINLSLIVFISAFSVLFCLNKFNNISLMNKTTEQLTIYELWHIESFEGGGANRQNYLNQIALSYEKSNTTTLLIIKQINAEQLKSALEQNLPHLISFSEQVAKIVLPYLKSFDKEYNIKDNFLQSANFNGKLMAIPFIASGYCYFTKYNHNTDLQLYTANNTLHNATSLVTGNFNDKQTLSSYQCYTKFINSKNIKLLGTARDLFRIKNLENLGRFEVIYEPVSTFTDLIQYLGKTTNDKNLDKFINYIISDENQYKLTNLSLFSTKHLKLYSNSIYSDMENCLSSCFVPNIFI